MFIWWCNWFFIIISVYQCFFNLNLLFDEVGSEFGHEKKKTILFDTIYIIFLKKKTPIDVLNQWLVVALVENK